MSENAFGIASRSAPELRVLVGTLILLALMSGCAAEPFQRPPLPILHNPDPSTMVRQFRESLPGEFTSEDTVIIEAPFRNDQAVMAVLRVDRRAKTFRLIGLHQMGISAFDVGGDQNGPVIYSAIPQLMEHKELLLGIATDIQRMYFDLTPIQDALAWTRSTYVCFIRKASHGWLGYQFGDEPATLLEKRFRGLFGTIWRVRYYDYRPGPGGKLFPHGIVMDNYLYHYRIIVKNRTWSVEPQ